MTHYKSLEMEHNSHMIIGILLHILGSGGCTYRNREYEPGATVNIAVAPKYASLEGNSKNAQSYTVVT